LTVGSEPPFSEDLSTEAEEQALLEAVTRQLLVKTLRDGKDFVRPVVLCNGWTLAMVQYLSVVTSLVFKWSINPISDHRRDST
jgi:hypothetical protein